MHIIFNRLFAFVAVLLSLTSCGSGSGGGTEPTPPAEENLVVVFSPDANATTPVVTMGTTYAFNIVVQSKMPAQGVDAVVTYRKDADNSVVFTQNYTSTASTLGVNITGIPFNEAGTVTVVVTSKSKATNSVTKTFRLTRK